MMTTQFNSIFRALALTATVAIAMPVFAQTTKARVDIPIAFEMGQTSMPAGHYLVERQASGWQIYVTDPTGVTRALLTTPVGSTASPSKGRLVFEKLGGTYRLAEIHLEGAPYGVQIPATKAQIELAKRQRPERIEVAMLSR